MFSEAGRDISVYVDLWDGMSREIPAAKSATFVHYAVARLLFTPRLTV